MSGMPLLAGICSQTTRKKSSRRRAKKDVSKQEMVDRVNDEMKMGNRDQAERPVNSFVEVLGRQGSASSSPGSSLQGLL